MNKLIIMSGIPGSGKTTVALGLKTILPKVVVVSSDDVRKKVTGDVNDGTKEPLVWETFEKDIIQASKEYDIVVADSTALTNELRMKWFNAFRPHFKHIELIYLDIPFEICWQRNMNRTRNVPMNPMAGMFKLMELPNEQVLRNFDSIISIKEEDKTSWKRD